MIGGGPAITAEQVQTKGAVAWVVEKNGSDAPPYLTLKVEVALKRFNAGDFVTPYMTCNVVGSTNNSEEL